eukprot:scpid104188/ scgid6881/ 
MVQWETHREEQDRYDDDEQQPASRTKSVVYQPLRATKVCNMTVGVAGQLHTWLQNHLHNRSLSVILNGLQSLPYAINAGAPQGSILGPTSFLVYVNDAKLCLSGATERGSFCGRRDPVQCAQLA